MGYNDFFVPFPKIYTDRLVIRLPKKRDVTDMFELCSAPETSHFSDWEPHKSKRESKQYIAWLISNYNKRKCLTWAVELRSTGKMIGTCSFVEMNCNFKIAQIGYSFNKDYYGKGYATEAVSELISFGFHSVHLSRIEAKVMPDNEPSVKLLERVSMSREALIKKGAYCKDKCVDVYLYGMTDEQYFSKIQKREESFAYSKN